MLMEVIMIRFLYWFIKIWLCSVIVYYVCRATIIWLNIDLSGVEALLAVLWIISIVIAYRIGSLNAWSLEA